MYQAVIFSFKVLQTLIVYEILYIPCEQSLLRSS